ncbi:FAD-binding domain-containing protein 29 [Elsinoe australis]|uniref:FAD-binding domain-containing protein 29 n=1 Tax=Elsinoe australis TaxID=40998 RepID=A0A4U7AVS6_9PEZI|nr:FAD-binding domain-containing protein 29 [Elsinoe australis]
MSFPLQQPHSAYDSMGSSINDRSDSPIELSPSGIDILIVGTGFAGLTAALECTRKGHHVRLLERNASHNMAGDMYFMGLSATHFLKHWPAMQQRYAEISLQDAWIETFKHTGEQMLPPQKVADRLHAQGLDPGKAPGAFQMRPLVYKMLLDQVNAAKIDVQFGTRVVDYFEIENQKGGVKLDDGRVLEADLVIAADGIGSKSQKLVGGQIKARSSGRAMWRAVFPVEEMDKDPVVKEHFGLQDGSDPIVRTFFAPGSYALTLTRKDVVVWIINHDVTGSEAESWTNQIEADEVLHHMQNTPGQPWCPIFQGLVRCSPPKSIINFDIWWRDPQATWASPEARVVQIGDSAHSFLPSSGNGATQAIEDAVSLASCLELGGKKNIEQAVRVHERLRFTRTACAQKLGFANAELLQKTDWNEVKIDPRKSSPKLPKWIWQHDPERYAYENYRPCLESMEKGIRMEDEPGLTPNWPPGYRYEPWTIDEIIQDLKNGQEVDLGTGDWS